MPRMRRLPLIAVLVVGLASPAWADFDDGVAAYNRGDYATALKEFWALAVQGAAAAQFDLGLMYENGQGVPQDYAEAVKWYRLAAEQEIAEARLRDGVARVEAPG